ncbi:MAG: RagB/SusD family nutrient uptake outer membrane protein [Leeuwenhoekiella sp.]
MMKKINILLLAILTVFYSCEDAIDIEQVGRLVPEVTFETLTDLERGVFGAYSFFDTTSEIALASQYTDEVAIGVATGGQGLTEGFPYRMNAAVAASSALWTQGYGELNAVNIVIEGSELIELEEGEQEAFDDYLGQLYALRAFAHTQLLSYYSPDYRNDSAPGVIIVDFVATIDQQLPRNTTGEVWAAILADLDRAEDLLATESNPTFVSLDFVKALRARIAAYRGNYEIAEPLAMELLEDYPLAARDEYEAIWTDQSNAEIIFKLERVVNDGYDGQGAQGSVTAGGWAGNNYAFVNATAGGGAFFEFDRGLFNLFDEDDIRYDAFVAPSSIVADDYLNVDDYRNNDVLVIQKYPGIAERPLMNDLKVFRSSEMLMIIAEARAAAGDLGGVAEAIKRLRDARFEEEQPLATYASQTEAYAAILNEKRVEFAFEGHRWKDLKRLGDLANQDAVRDERDCAEEGVDCSLASDSFKFTLPIPLAEIEGNPILRTQQNPGY